MNKDDKKNLDNFRREIKLKELQQEEKIAEYTKEFPLEELKAMSVEGLEIEIDKILLK